MVGDEVVGEVSTEHLSTYQKDCLLQLVLTCLVNAMEVHVKFVAAVGSMDISMAAPEGSSVMSQFLESTKDVVACDIIETLMDIMRRANTKPHHAYLAVKALFLLSSENSVFNFPSLLIFCPALFDLISHPPSINTEHKTKHPSATFGEVKKLSIHHGIFHQESKPRPHSG